MVTHELLTQALDALREGFGLFDPNLRLLHSNKRFHEILRTPVELRKPGTDLEVLTAMRARRGDFGPGDSADLAEAWLAHARDPSAHEHQLKGDVIGIVLERFVPIPGFGVVVTITDHARVYDAEAKIARMAKFPDENPGPVLRFGPDNRMSYANPSSRDLCNRAGCVSVGDPAPPDWLPHFSRARDQGRPEEVEYENAGAVYSLLFCPVSGTDEINAYGGDITERIRHGEELAKAKEEADRANLTKSQFLANMSHELRTPMNAIMGFTKLVMRRSKNVLDAKQYDNLNKVLVSAGHLLALINNILDLSKIEAGRMDVNASWFDLGALVELCTKTIEPLVKDGVVLEVSIPPDLPEMLNDEIKVKQILLNLLSNAAKFTREGSIKLTVTLDDDIVSMAIADTGIGIPPDALGRVFDEFSQADGSTTREFGGTGLGLTICLRLARLMEGDIEVESVVGEGTVFTATIPIRHGGAPPRQTRDSTPVRPPTTGPSEPSTATRQPPLVLAIDDDENQLQLIRENLGDSGFRVVTALSGADGLKKARILKPAAITLDVIMGSSDGWQVLHALKSDPTTSDIPVVMLSVLEQQSLAFRLGASEYLAKPVERSDLLAAVSRVTTAKARILVVDDNPDVIELLGQILEEEGHEMIAASNGEEGLARINDSKPDLVFLDLMMPILDGFGLLDRLREHPEHRDLPIVILTAKVLSIEEELDLRKRTHRIVTKGGEVRASLLEQLQAIVGPSPARRGTK